MSSKCRFLFKVIAVISWHSRNIELQHAQRYIIIKLKLGNKIDKKRVGSATMLIRVRLLLSYSFYDEIGWLSNCVKYCEDNFI